MRNRGRVVVPVCGEKKIGKLGIGGVGSVNLVDFGDLRWLEPPSLFYLVNAGALCFALIDALVCWKQMSNRNQMLKHD